MHENREEDQAGALVAGKREVDESAEDLTADSPDTELILTRANSADRRKALRSLGGVAVALLAAQTLSETAEAAKKNRGKGGERSTKGGGKVEKRNDDGSRNPKTKPGVASEKKGKKPKPPKPFSSQVSLSTGTVAVGATTDLSATCPAGKAVLGCGFEKPDGSFDITLVALAADTEQRRCTGRFSRNNSNPDASGAIEVTAICAG